MTSPNVLGLHTPLGLGWRRHLDLPEHHPAVSVSESASSRAVEDSLDAHASAVEPGMAFVLTGLHALGAEPATTIAARLPGLSQRHPIVLCSAGAFPAALTELLDSKDRVGPVTEQEFGRRHPEAYPSSGGWTACGGWPEAGRWDDGWFPSEELEEFVSAVCESSEEVFELLVLTAVSDRGLPPEVLSGITGRSLDEVFATAEQAETLGLFSWFGTLLQPAFPLLADAVTCTQTRVRMAAAAIATNPLARRFGLAVIPAVKAGIDLDAELREEALAALAEAETAIDVARWLYLAEIFQNHPDPGIRRAGGDSTRRLMVIRGQEEDLRFTRLGLSENPQEELYRRFLTMDGLSAPAVVDSSAQIDSVFPSDQPVDHIFRPIISGVVAGLRGDERAVAASLMELSTWSDQDAVPTWLIALFSGDREKTLEVELKNFDNPHLSVLVTIRHASEGRFVLAARRLRALLGDDWRDAAPLYRFLALQVAAGMDVEQARFLLAHTRFPRIGQFGTVAAAFVRARAEFVTGDPKRARERVLEIWELATRQGFVRPFLLFGGEFLTIVADGGDLSPVTTLEPEGDLKVLVQLARALEAERFDANTACGHGSELISLYSQSHANVLVADRAIREGDTDTALRLLSVAEASFGALGAPVDAARARRALRVIDPSLDRGRHSEFDQDTNQGVTGREKEVLDLVAKGLTNKEIAASLHLSVATVKRHVTALLRHFDVNSRRQLMDIARQAD